MKYGKRENENLMLLENGNKLLNGVKAIEAAVYQIIIKYSKVLRKKMNLKN